MANNETIAEQALMKIFSATSLASPLLLSSSSSNVDCFYWRIFCEHLKREKVGIVLYLHFIYLCFTKLDSALDDALPTLSEYCDIVRETSSSENTDSFKLRQLLLGCSLFDIADEVGRSKLIGLLGILSCIASWYDY